MTGGEKLTLTGIAVVIVGVFLLVFSPVAIVPAGNVGIVTAFGKPTGRITDAGLVWKTPLIEAVVTTNLRVVKDEINASAATKDLQDVTVKVAVNRQIKRENVVDLYNKVGTDTHLKDVVISPAVQEVVKQITAQFTAEELLTKRADVKARVDEALLKRLEQYYVITNDVSIVNFEFSKDFNEAIEKKQVAEQTAKQAVYEKQLSITQKEAEVAVAKLGVEKAGFEAEAYKLQSRSLTSQILQRMYLEKWDGHLPTTVADSKALQLLLGK